MGDDKRAVSRRSLLRRAAAGAAAVGTQAVVGRAAADVGPVPATQPIVPPPAFDFTAESDALAADRVVDSACQFCNCNCRLKVRLRAGRVIDVAGEPADPVQAGGLCVKGPMMTQLAYNRLRLTTPLRRVGGAKGSPDSRFEPVSWDAALDLVADRLLALRDGGEARAIANKTSGRLLRGTGSLVHRLFTMLGSPNDTDVGPVCNDSGGDALRATFGLPNFTNGYGVDPVTGREDLGSAKFFLFVGTNQAECHPVTFAHLLRCRRQTGAKLVVVDPRRTPTSHQADDWVGLKPGTDMALVLGMLHHIITGGLHDAAFVRRWVVGFDELKRHLVDHGYTADWAAGVCDVPAEQVRRTATAYATAKPAAIFCNAGVSHQVGAFDTYRVLAMLAAVTGNVGTPGGGANFMHNTWPGGLDLPPVAGELPTVTDPALPVGPDAFADAILTGRPYPLKAILTCGNPLVASANTDKVRRAFAQLDFYCYTGLFMEEAALYADVILPACSGFEITGVYGRRDDRGIRWQTAAVPRVGQSRPDPEIWIGLAHALARRDTKRPPSYWTDAFPLEWADYRTLWSTFVAHTPGMGGMTADRLQARAEPLRWPCPTADHAGVSTMYLDHPSWYAALESLDPAQHGKRFPTPSGRVELYTDALQAKLVTAGHAALPRFYAHPAVTGDHPTVAHRTELVDNPVVPGTLTPVADLNAVAPDRAAFPLMGTVGRPSVVHFAEVTQWTYAGKQLNGVRLVQVHPATAAAAGIADGDAIRVESPLGSITATASLFAGIRPDTVFVPNTFGPAQAVGDDFGLPRYEPANVLLDDRHFDNLSGQQAYKCFACRVRKA